MNNIDLPEKIKLNFDRTKPNWAEVAEDTWLIYNGVLYELKYGYWTDGKSNPGFSKGFIGGSFEGRELIPSVWHDVFFNTHYFPRAKANQIYDELNEYCGVSYARRKIIQAGLFVGSYWVYKNKTEEMIAGASKHLFINNRQYRDLFSVTSVGSAFA